MCSSDLCSLTFNPLSPQIYGTLINASCYCSNPETNAELWRDNINVTDTENNQYVSTMGAGEHIFVCNSTETVNYLGATNTSNYTVTQAIGVVYTYVDLIRANISIMETTSIWLNGTLINGSGEIFLYLNNSLINYGQSPLYNYTLFNSTGIYNVTTIYLGNANFTSDSEVWWINVTPFSILPPVNISILDFYKTWVRLGWTDLQSGVTTTVEYSSDNTSWRDIGNTTIEKIVVEDLNVNLEYFFRLKNSQGNLTSTWAYISQETESDETLISIIIGLLIAIAFFGIFGFMSKGFGLKIFFYGIALIELITVAYFLYINELNYSLLPMLRLNFYILFILGFGIGMISMIMLVLRLINPADDDDELSMEEKWNGKSKWQK